VILPPGSGWFIAAAIVAWLVAGLIHRANA
jgi:hypothetical protein